MKNLLPCVLFVVEAGNVADQMGHTSGAGKYAKILNLLDEGMALSQVDFSKVGEEGKAVLASDVLKAELMTKVKDKLDLADDKLEALIEEGVALAEKQVSVVKDAIALVKKLKA